MADVTHRHMSEANAADDTSAGERSVPRAALFAGALMAAILFAGALLLWQRHGATVFFDTLTAGIAACL